MDLKELIGKLREATGSGVAMCKKALETTGGGIEAAVDWLRKQGHAQAAKVADRATEHGLIAMALEKSKASLILIGCETDFVSGNEEFGQLASEIAHKALNNNNLEELQEATDEEITNAIARIRENIIVKDIATIEGEHVTGYVYRTSVNSIKDIGKKGCIIAYKTDDKNDKSQIAQAIAMHIVVHDTKYLTHAQIPADFIDKEKGIMKERMEQEGKSAEIIERILKGCEQSIYKEHSLLSQPYFQESNITIEELCKRENLEITDFKTLSL